MKKSFLKKTSTLDLNDTELARQIKAGKYASATQLDFTRWKLSNHGAKLLAEFLEQHPTISELNLQSNINIDNTGADFLRTAIIKKGLAVSIDLTGTGASPAKAEEISLIAKQNYIVNNILSIHPRTINLTTLPVKSIDEKFIEALANCLQQKQTEHDELRIPDDIQFTQTSLEKLAIIKQCLFNNKTKNILGDLKKNDIELKKQGKPELRTVNFFAIAKKSTLDKEQKIKYVKGLCEALKNDAYFTNFTMHICDIGDDTAVDLSNLLANNRTLSKVNLSGNLFTDEGIKKIMAGIQDNTSLKELDITYNKLTKDYEEELSSTNQSNKALALKMQQSSPLEQKRKEEPKQPEKAAKPASPSKTPGKRIYDSKEWKLASFRLTANPSKLPTNPESEVPTETATHLEQMNSGTVKPKAYKT